MRFIFYSLATGWHSIIHTPDLGKQPRAPAIGEGITPLSDALYAQQLSEWQGDGTRDFIQEYLNTVTGMTPQPCQYATVHNGIVVNIMGKLDPILHQDATAAEQKQYPGMIQVALQPGLVVALGATYNTLTGFTNPVEQILKGVGVVLGNLGL